MTFREWEEKYKPISVTPYALFSDDYEELKDPRRREKNLWTVIEGDDSGLYITNDFHFVNRVGYVLTEVDFEGGQDIEICWVAPDEFSDEPEQGFSQEDIDAARREAVAEERAAVVAWLREEAASDKETAKQYHHAEGLAYWRGVIEVLEDAADCIDRGEHRREEA